VRIAGSVLSGLYPAFVLYSYKPVEVLKGKFRNTWKGLYVRKGLVIFQFVATVVLLVGTFTVYQQMSYMRQQDLGVNIDQTLIIRAPASVDSTYAIKFDVFRNTVCVYPEVTAVAASTSIPGELLAWNAGGI